MHYLQRWRWRWRARAARRQSLCLRVLHHRLMDCGFDWLRLFWRRPPPPPPPPPTSRSAPCECHKTRFLGRGQQHLRGVPVVPCGPNSRVTQPRTAMSAGNLAHLIDFGVGKEEDCLLDNSFAATRPAPETLTTTTSPTMPIS